MGTWTAILRWKVRIFWVTPMHISRLQNNQALQTRQKICRANYRFEDFFTRIFPRGLCKGFPPPWPENWRKGPARTSIELFRWATKTECNQSSCLRNIHISILSEISMKTLCNQPPCPRNNYMIIDPARNQQPRKTPKKFGASTQEEIQHSKHQPRQEISQFWIWNKI